MNGWTLLAIASSALLIYGAYYYLIKYAPYDVKLYRAGYDYARQSLKDQTMTAYDLEAEATGHFDEFDRGILDCVNDMVRTRKIEDNRIYGV